MYFSWSAMSIAPGRAVRTWIIALSFGMPSSIRSRAAIVPDLPSPPLQWTSMCSPWWILSTIFWTTLIQELSNDISGPFKSFIGRWIHYKPLSIIASPIISTLLMVSSSLGIRVITVVGPNLSRMRSRSRKRSLFQVHPKVDRLFFPGQIQTPILPG